MSQVTAVGVIDLGTFSGSDASARAARFAHRKLGGIPLIVRMARRLSESMLLEKVYVTGASVPKELMSAATGDVAFINQPMSHLCERLAAAADEGRADWVVYLPGNRPFVDAGLVDRLMATAQKTDCDYVGFRSTEDDFRKLDHLGLAGEAIHVDSLRRLRRNADRLPCGDHGSMASWLQSAPGAYHLKFLPLPAELDRDDLRFAVEDELDWDDAELLYETVSESDGGWRDLTDVLEAHRELRQSMAFRNKG